MKPMRVASIALAAYLVNSVLRRSITSTRSWLRAKGANSERISVARSSSALGHYFAIEPRVWLKYATAVTSGSQLCARQPVKADAFFRRLESELAVHPRRDAYPQLAAVTALRDSVRHQFA